MTSDHELSDSIKSEDNIENWLTNEDASNHQDRLTRLRWMADQYPQCEYIGFSGGLITNYLFEETRYCFAYGQYLATIVLGLAFIEQSIASQFYAVGKDPKKSAVSNLFDEALQEGWITQTEFDNLDHARKIRNPVAHFRKYSKDDRLERRAVEENEYPYSILESDAYHVMETIFLLMQRKVLCQTI